MMCMTISDQNGVSFRNEACVFLSSTLTKLEENQSYVSEVFEGRPLKCDLKVMS